MLKPIARGAPLARVIIERAQNKAAALERKLGRLPRVVLVASDDRDGRRFVQLKKDALADVAMDIDAVWLDQHANTATAVDAIRELNGRADVDAIFLQFPLPSGIDAAAASNAVAIAKDFDCSGEEAERLFLAGNNPFTPVAPHAALDLLTDQLGSLAGKDVVICGGNDPFTRVLHAVVERAGARTTLIDPSGSDGSNLIEADAFVIGDPLPAPRVLQQIKSARVLLDAGYYLPPRPKDWLPDDVGARIRVHLGQYGNVGPLTVAHIAHATLRAAELNAS